MEKKTLQAEVRTERGKGPVRRLRAAGKLPAVLYGPGVEPTSLTVDPKELEASLRGEMRRNQVFDLEFGGKKVTTMVRDLLVHPVDRSLLHVDFYAVSDDRPVDTVVPIFTKGRSKGVQRGGKLTVALRTLALRAAPTNIPADVTIDVTNVDIGDVIHVADIELPEGVVATLPPKQTVLGVYEDRRAVAKGDEEPAK
jgi:large subunit ribosomal protein L25